MQRLRRITEYIQTKKTCKIVGSDETTVNENGKRVYTWTWQNQYASYFVRGPDQGFDVVERNFIAKFNGSYVHDDYGAQNTAEAVVHQHCHPHITRKLEYCTGCGDEAWAPKVQELLYKSQRARDIIWREDFSEDLRNREKIFPFLYDPDLPFDNNGSERAHRSLCKLLLYI